VLPEDFGLKLAPIETLAGGDAETNAGILRSVFAGEKGARRDVVVMNAAAALVTAGASAPLKDGVRLAEGTIDSGAVTRLLEELAGV
jgi:anthranilate phosphoribosyltransferase